MHVAPTRQLPVVRLYKGSAPADLPGINSIHFRVAAKVRTKSSTTDQGPRKLLRLLRMIFSLSVLMDFCEWARLDVTSTPQKSSTAQLDKSTHTRHMDMDAEKVV